MSIRRLKAFGPLLVLATAAATGLTACGKSAGGGEPQHAAATTPTVGVVTLKAEDATLTTELPGRTMPYRVAEVRPQVSGILKKRLFTEGALVKAGDPLYQIDAAPYEATLARAQATYETDKLLFERYQKLIERRAVSQQDFDNARSQYLEAKADLRSAQINVGYTRITAPISGRISRSSLTEGALVTANQTEALARISQLDPIYVDVNQPSTELLRLKDELANGKLKQVGDNQAEVKLILENGKPYPLAGTLQFSEVTVDSGTGAVTMRAEFANPDQLLLPGMFVRAELQEGVQSNAILVPQEAVMRDATGRAMSYVVGTDGKVQRRDVVTDRTVGSDYLISDGLKAGDKLITIGYQSVQPGEAVTAEPAEQMSQSGAAAAPHGAN